MFTTRHRSKHGSYPSAPFQRGTALENGFIPVAQTDFSRTETAHCQGQRRCAVQSILNLGCGSAMRNPATGNQQSSERILVMIIQTCRDTADNICLAVPTAIHDYPAR